MIAEYFILDDIWLGYRGSTYNVISQRPDLYIFSDLCFLYDGKLVELEYYLNASGSFYFALWRKIDLRGRHGIHKYIFQTYNRHCRVTCKNVYELGIVHFPMQYYLINVNIY